MIITTSPHDKLIVSSISKIAYFSIINAVNDEVDGQITVHKPAIPQLIEVLTRIHNGESV